MTNKLQETWNDGYKAGFRAALYALAIKLDTPIILDSTFSDILDIKAASEGILEKFDPPNREPDGELIIGNNMCVPCIYGKFVDAHIRNTRKELPIYVGSCPKGEQPTANEDAASAFQQGVELSRESLLACLQSELQELMQRLHAAANA